jgi:hypothetical protein
LSFNSKLSYFDKNLNVNHKGFLNARVNVVQHLRDFGRFEMNKRDLGRQREDRILVAEKEILHKIKNQPQITNTRLTRGAEVFCILSNLPF